MIVTKGSNDTSEHDRARCGIVPRTETNREEGGQVWNFPRKARDHNRVWKDFTTEWGIHWKERVCPSMRGTRKKQTAVYRKGRMGTCAERIWSWERRAIDTSTPSWETAK